MKWDEFKAMPDEHKVTYIKLLRNKWNVPDAALAIMFGVSSWSVGREMKRLGLNDDIKPGKKAWDKEGFTVWVYGVPKTEEVEEAAEEVPEDQEMETVAEVACEPVVAPVRGEKVIHHAIPHTGNLYFEGKIEDITNTLGVLLAGARVGIGIKWAVLEVQDGE